MSGPESIPVHRCGFAALVGRPNVGKSTLLNALTGQKISIVTPRPQTTRHRVLGLVNLPDAQIAFVDTPGLHRQQGRALNRAMNRTAAAAALDADVVVLVVEALRFGEEDALALSRAAESGHPVVAVVNKIDTVKQRERLLPYLAELGKRHAFAEVIPVSARDSRDVQRLVQVIAKHLPESPALFPADQVTDRSEDFRIAENIREKLTLELNEELPYGIAVEVESRSEDEGQLIIHAVIWVDREGQKPIVIGARGERLKRIGTQARKELNELLGRRLHLELWVKVREDWADSAHALRQLGME
ncbi:MAG TPA: GTPase Era [Steroidobacteraceae bacterium]|nr:GTPase Era [Steroidobacteraceae bacterium]